MTNPAKKCAAKPTITGNNWYSDGCYIVIHAVTLSLSPKCGNKSCIKGSGNKIMQKGNGNDSNIQGDKNLVAEHGNDNMNVTKGGSNKIGQNGNGNQNKSEQSTNGAIIYQESLSGIRKAKSNMQKPETDEKKIDDLVGNVFKDGKAKK